MKFNPKTVLLIISIIAIFSLSISSYAQDETTANSNNRSLSLLFDCAKITSDTERLLCQDTEIKKLQNATKAKTLVVFDEKSVKEIKKRSFGFSLPNLGLAELSKKSEKSDTVILGVKSIQNSGRRLTVIMENGQVWQSVNADFGYIPKKGKFEAKVKSAAFGSFSMRLSNERVKSKKIRVRRIE